MQKILPRLGVKVIYLNDLIFNLIIIDTRSSTMRNSLYISVIARNIAKVSVKSKGLGCLHGMQKIQVRFLTEAIFFAVNLSHFNFFKIKFGKLEELLFQYLIALKVRQYRHAIIIFEIDSFMNHDEYIRYGKVSMNILGMGKNSWRFSH